jgi:hypothetical protein
MTPTQELDAFIRRFTPEIAALTRKALVKMRKLTPGALELVYDNYNALAIGFCPTERAGDGIFSIAVYPRLVRVFFLQGKRLPDPTKRLQGSGSVVRSIPLESVHVLDEPDIRALVDGALERAKIRLDPKQRRRTIIKSVSAKQRPRRPNA